MSEPCVLTIEPMQPLTAACELASATLRRVMDCLASVA